MKKRDKKKKRKRKKRIIKKSLNLQQIWDKKILLEKAKKNMKEIKY